MDVNLEVGMTATFTRCVKMEDIELFARISGDSNPIHLDEAYALQSRFRSRIAHGMLIAGHISAALGTILPGPGCIYLNQELAFKAPVFPGDVITTTLTITNVREDKPIVVLKTQCHNQRKELVIDGQAVLLC